MDASRVVVKHLLAAQRDLLVERDKIDATLAQVESMLRQYAGTVVSEDDLPLSTVRREGGRPTGPSPMREAILDYLRQAPTALHRSADIAKHITENFPWEAASVRSELSKMAAEGAIHKPQRGMYALELLPSLELDAETRASLEDAEAPAGTGASDGEESSDGSSRKEGGTDGAAPAGRDLGAGDTDRDHGHGFRASIEEARAS